MRLVERRVQRGEVLHTLFEGWSPITHANITNQVFLHSPVALCDHIPLHQQNVNRSGSNMQSSQTPRATSPVLLSAARRSQTPLELRKALSDSARAFSGAPESTCSSGGAFRMLRDLTYRIVKFGSSWDLCEDLREASREAETAA